MKAKAVFAAMMFILLGIVACEHKAEKPQPEGKLEITVEPDPLMIAPEPADLAITATGQETGGAALTLSRVTVVITYLDSTHIVIGPEDLTTTKFTWEATSPEEGGPLSGLLEEFWHFDATEEKEFEIPIKVGYGLSAPPDFAGLYLSTIYIQAGMGQGKQGFLVSLTYEGVDEHGHPLTGSAALRLKFQPVQ